MFYLDHQYDDTDPCVVSPIRLALVLVLALLAAVFGLPALLSMRSAPEFRQNGLSRRLRRAASGEERQPPSHHDFVARPRDACLQASPLSFPSGQWRGYYTFSGCKHDVCEFILKFDPSGAVEGSGTDDVGQYKITGRFGLDSRRVAFTKQYIRGTRNAAGQHKGLNKGHQVEYRGELAGSALGAGVRGKWTIRHFIGDYDGVFHLWPAMEGWTDTTGPSSAEFFEAAEGTECVVCYDRQINTCLLPCGHVALCSVCAQKVKSKGCPICRSEISSTILKRPANKKAD